MVSDSAASSAAKFSAHLKKHITLKPPSTSSWDTGVVMTASTRLNATPASLSAAATRGTCRHTHASAGNILAAVDKSMPRVQLWNDAVHHSFSVRSSYLALVDMAVRS